MNTGLYRLTSKDREKKTLCRAKRHKRSPDLMNTHRHSVTIFAVQILLNVYQKNNIPPGTVHTTMLVLYIAKKGSQIITKETLAFRTKVSCLMVHEQCNRICKTPTPLIISVLPRVDSVSNRNEYQEYFLGVNAAGA
jgi:hypothetical protein